MGEVMISGLRAIAALKESTLSTQVKSVEHGRRDLKVRQAAIEALKITRVTASRETVNESWLTRQNPRTSAPPRQAHGGSPRTVPRLLRRHAAPAALRGAVAPPPAKPAAACSSGGRSGRQDDHRGRAGAAKVSSRDPDDTSPLVRRRVWLGMAWGAFTAASAAALAATGRFMFPNVLNEPPPQFKVGLPADFGMGVDERYQGIERRLDRADDRRHRSARQRVLRAQHDVHAPRVHAELSWRPKPSSSARATAAGSG